MIVIKRTDSSNLDFQKLVQQLDQSLGNYYKEEIAFYEDLNAIDKIKHVAVAYDERGNCIGCGGIKIYSADIIEIKRMFVPILQRGKGIATLILNELENWSRELHFKKSVLETLKEKEYAIKFYKKNGYSLIPNFGEYILAENSICFEKKLKI